MTDEEKAVIEAAERCPNVLCFEAPPDVNVFHPPPEYAELLRRVASLRNSRKPKPRFVTRSSGFGEAVWDREKQSFVPPSECAVMLNVARGDVP